MRGPTGHQLPHELEPVATLLRAHRASAEPLELDRIKQRALARRIAVGGRVASLRSHVAAVMTVVLLAAGSGGVLSLASGASGGSAARAQYCRNHDRDRRHHHSYCERRHRYIVRHCRHDRFFDRHKRLCRREHREIRHCRRHHSKRYCLKHAAVASPQAFRRP